ncbi:aspartic proteinase 36-like [Wolffia australiana]
MGLPPGPPGAGALLFFILFFLPRELGVSGHLGSPAAPDLGLKTGMILPLDFREANSSRIEAIQADRGARRRLRLLQGAGDHKQSARMRLYDDLLTRGYYTTRLMIGTPPQEFALIVDSGSTVTYVPCSTCQHCGLHQDPRFQPDESSTYEPLKCNAECSCDEEKNQCTYDRQYAERSTSSGVLGEDVISFGNESNLAPQRAVFGCENSETGDLFSQHADGIMGLGHGPLSVVDQLVKKGVISDSFSLCYGGMGVGGGAMVLGEISPPPDMVFSYSDAHRSPYYNLDLKEIRVAGKKLLLKSRIFNGKHGTVLDSGTTYAYLPTEAFTSLRDAVMNHVASLKLISGPDPNFKDICFYGAGSDASHLSETFPEVDMVFGNGQKLLLSPENYLFQHSKVKGAYCLGIFNNENDQTTLLGGIIVRNTLVMYDRAKQRVGFWKTNCSSLQKNVQLFNDSPLLAPAPSPSVITGNSTEAPFSALPPKALSDLLAGDLNVSIISFDMHVNINKSEMMKHLPELSEAMARDLEVNVSQVNFVRIESEGQGTFIQWDISPLGSTRHFSRDAAVDIITRLLEYRVRLPENFGPYKIMSWKVGLTSERTWWKRHLLTIAGGSLGIIVVAFISAFLLWRHQQRENAYAPVNPDQPEQELQPL